MAFIYTLSDPRTGFIRYVGQTAEAPETRLRKHLWPSTLKREICHRTKWIASLLSAGITPVIEVVEVVDGAAVNEAEVFWIEQFRALGFDLVNESAGGDGWTKGRKRGPMSAEHRAAISAGVKGKKRPPRSAEHTEKLRQRNIGRQLSEEHRMKLSEAAKRSWAERNLQKIGV